METLKKEGQAMKHYFILISYVVVALFAILCSLHCLRVDKYLIAGIWFFLFVNEARLIYRSIKDKQE